MQTSPQPGKYIFYTITKMPVIVRSLEDGYIVYSAIVDVIVFAVFNRFEFLGYGLV
jgi:hypothetical protein